MPHFSLPKDGGLIPDSIPNDILHSYEKIPTEIFSEPTDASEAVADLIVDEIKANGGKLRLGLSTGSSPRTLYQILANKYAKGLVSFKDVELFSIDEYYPCNGIEKTSRNTCLHEELINLVDFQEKNVHFPDGTASRSEVSAYCAEYDRLARNLDLLVMGIGELGQIGFNEAGSSDKSRTRVVILGYRSRNRQAKNFKGNVDLTPKTAITMGISTMLSAKKIVLMAWGEDKATAVRRNDVRISSISSPAAR